MNPDTEAHADDGPFTRIAIVGFGLIGGSIALAARKRWPRTQIIAIDRPDVVATALRSAAADDGGEHLRLCAGADLIVLAAPVETNARILCDLPNHVAGTAMVTDVGSTKRQVAEVLPSTARATSSRRPSTSSDCASARAERCS